MLIYGSRSGIASSRIPARLLRLLGCALLALSTLSARAGEVADGPIVSFEIVRFEVQGNTLLPQPNIEAVLAPFTGAKREFSDVERAIEALRAAYHRRGFKLVQVVLPEQELTEGVVHLQVVEAHVGNVVVEGNRIFDQTNIRRSLPGLREGEVPDLDRISASLKLANESPAKKTTLQLQSSDTPDAVDATVRVADEKAWKVGLTVDNTGNSATGETRVGLLYQHANVLGLDHVASLVYTTSPDQPNNVSIYGAGYHIPLYRSGDSIDLYAAHSNVDAGTVSAGGFGLQVSGKGSASGIRYNQNLGSARGIESKLSYGLDYRAYEDDAALSGVPIGSDVTVHPVSLTYLAKWTPAAAEMVAYMGAAANVPGGKNGSDADFERVRTGASADYTLLRYGASYRQGLPREWQMYLNLSGQYTRDLLIPGEQFAVGGATTVRGFQEREIAGDVGYFYNAELLTPDLCSGIKRADTHCRALVFVDGARLWRNQPLPGEDSGASIGSVGVGMRMSIDRNVSVRIDMAQVIDAGGTEAKGDRRIHFSVGFYY